MKENLLLVSLILFIISLVFFVLSYFMFHYFGKDLKFHKEKLDKQKQAKIDSTPKITTSIYKI